MCLCPRCTPSKLPMVTAAPCGKSGALCRPSLILIVAFGYVVKQAVIVNGIAVYRQCAARYARPTLEKQANFPPPNAPNA